jgi:nucleotide-binding universal stress UspA family protein
VVEFQKILVPLDGSPLAEAALPLALSLAQRYQSRLLLITASDVLTASQYVTHPEALQLLQRVRDETLLGANDYLQDKQRELRKEGVDVQILVTEGEPAAVILEAAAEQDVDLIVMSSHGRGGLARWSFGSVSDRVLRHSPCPVLVVRQGAKTPEPA